MLSESLDSESVQIHAAKDNSGIHRSRVQLHIDAATGMETDPGNSNRLPYRGLHNPVPCILILCLQ